MEIKDENRKKWEWMVAILSIEGKAQSDTNESTEIEVVGREMSTNAGWKQKKKEKENKWRIVKKEERKKKLWMKTNKIKVKETETVR